MFRKLLEKLQNLFRQDEVYKMNRADAAKTLEHVFEAAGKKPNHEPLEKLAVKKKRPGQPYMHGVIFAAVALLLALLAPLVFLPRNIPANAENDSSQDLQILRTHRDDELLYLELSFGDPDLSASYLQTIDGITQHPTGFNPERNELIFACPDPIEDTNVYIYNRQGELLHLRLSPVS